MSCQRNPATELTTVSGMNHKVIDRKTILIIEDEKTALKHFQFEAQEVFQNVLTASCVKEAQEVLSSSAIDVILCDYKLPDGHVLQLFEDFNIRERNVPVILITGHGDKDVISKSLNLGVEHFLEKPVSNAQLREYLGYCLEYVEKNAHLRELSERCLLHNHTREYLINTCGLSSREIDVINCMLVDDKNKTIGKRLYICEGTVKRHLQNIFGKMGISSKDELKEIIFQKNMSASSGQ